MKKLKLEIKTFGGTILFTYDSELNTVKKTLENAIKTGADLTGADLTGADLRGAYLTGADLTGAYLRGAYLRGADLTGAYLTGADGEKIEVKKALVINGLYKYVCIPFISSDDIEWLTLGCYTRTLKDWKKDFWNNESEFPNDKENENSQLRLLAFDTAKKWFKLQSAIN